MSDPDQVNPRKIVSEATSLLLKLDSRFQVPGEVDSLGDLISYAQGNVPDRELLEVLAKVLDLPFHDAIRGRRTLEVFVNEIPIAIARRFVMMAFVDHEGEIELGIGSYQGILERDNISRLLGQPLSIFLADPAEIELSINTAYQSRASQTTDAIQSLDGQGDQIEIQAADDLLDEAGKSSVIKLVNSILFDAVQVNASDIHIQPYEPFLQIRFRIDGVLFDKFEIPKQSQEEVVSRFKVIAKMDIAEKRLPQDGRASIRVGDRQIDLRVASIPTQDGERIVIRLLDKSRQLFTLDQIGMHSRIHEQFRRLVQREHGMVLVTGPTGSGKSTTLYASLQEIDIKQRNVLTLEDPIEYRLEGISQTQVNEKKGMTFERGLRNILRQDPDIIMVGEIRDAETAELAIQSSLTGHMVFSTLHTQDAPSAISRLIELGIEPYLVANSVDAALAQRLIRKICENCKTQVDPGTADNRFTESLMERVKSMWVGKGCDQCRGTGYRGRLGLFELMVVDEEISEAIHKVETTNSIRNIAIRNGMSRLIDDGIQKINAGNTTVEEVIRATNI